MSSPTRLVLAHKRLVVIGWIALTVAGIAPAGPASKALKAEFSVPDKESLEDERRDRGALRVRSQTAPRRWCPW